MFFYVVLSLFTALSFAQTTDYSHCQPTAIGDVMGFSLDSKGSLAFHPQDPTVIKSEKKQNTESATRTRFTENDSLYGTNVFTETTTLTRANGVPASTRTVFDDQFVKSRSRGNADWAPWKEVTVNYTYAKGKCFIQDIVVQRAGSPKNVVIYDREYCRKLEAIKMQNGISDSLVNQCTRLDNLLMKADVSRIEKNGRKFGIAAGWIIGPKSFQYSDDVSKNSKAVTYGRLDILFACRRFSERFNLGYEYLNSGSSDSSASEEGGTSGSETNAL